MPNYWNKLLIMSMLAWCCMALTPTATLVLPLAEATPTALPIQATISEESFAIGFSDTLKSAGKPFWFEASAILFDGKSLLVAHDKPMPDGRSSVGHWPGLNDATRQPPTYFTGDIFKRGIKYEEMTQSPDKKWTFLTTAFDRVKEGSADWDGYNMLLCWPSGKPADVAVLGTNGKGTSVALRDKISSVLALNDLNFYGVVRYFKVEGLAATADRLIVGIREEGNSFQDFKYVTRLLSIPYKVIGQGTNQHVELIGGFGMLATVNVAVQVPEQLPPNLALSSIKFDRGRGIFWLLTTFETPDAVGSYLWTATEAELKTGRMNLVRTPADEPLRLTHKAEDMTFLSPRSLLIIHDDDRLPTQINGTIRKPNQAAYTVLAIR
jgi:hypothetical protein